MNRRILVTGASGFIGSALCASLRAEGRRVRAAFRSVDSISLPDNSDIVAVGEVGAQTDWSAALAEVDCVIHCAARVHLMQETEADALTAYRQVNVAGTRRLAEQAAESGVRRLVFLSSIKANREQSERAAPFSFDELNHGFAPRGDQVIDSPRDDDGAPRSVRGDEANPEDPYGVSKWEAEQELWAVSAQTGFEVVMVRPPLVYGPGVKGNLARLLRWVARGAPLPLGAVRNQRSLVGLSNLVSLLQRCAEHPDAAGETFLASDGQDLSTPQLIRLMAEGMNRPGRLLPVPVAILQVCGSLLGKRREVDRLVDSLQVSIEHTQTKLGWTPPASVEEGVRDMARWYVGLQDGCT